MKTNDLVTVVEQRNATLNACKNAVAALVRVEPQILGILSIQDVEHAIRKCNDAIELCANPHGQKETT